MVGDMEPRPCLDLSSLRIGHGRDIHRLYPGAPLVLAGVNIPSPKGFDTHSDGDVVCHALVDAMAGALAEGDLGTHFPEDDPATAKAKSLGFVQEFAAVVRVRGVQVVNVDAYVTTDLVRLRPHIEAMRRSLAGVLAIDIERVSVKARSGDGLGPEGAGEAVSSNVAVLLLLPD